MIESTILDAHPGITVGICATGAPSHMGELLERVISETDLTPLKLRKVIVVASGCAEHVISELRQTRERDARVQLVIEDRRLGKADAINKIQANAEGHLLVMVNSDASPEPGAISKLLSAIENDRTVGAVSAVPVTKTRGNMTSLLVDFMWSAHNDCSLALNHMNVSNHSCDELVVFRVSALSPLPQDLV
ncbi:MAG: glycosyltransferase family 2 protein, partial [Thaumarchaeota archaeon]|nr:glycosyltransferase family 2 protein [Nitrososphaerota archaeon]